MTIEETNAASAKDLAEAYAAKMFSAIEPTSRMSQKQFAFVLEMGIVVDRLALKWNKVMLFTADEKALLADATRRLKTAVERLGLTMPEPKLSIHAATLPNFALSQHTHACEIAALREVVDLITVHFNK